MNRRNFFGAMLGLAGWVLSRGKVYAEEKKLLHAGVMVGDAQATVDGLAVASIDLKYSQPVTVVRPNPFSNECYYRAGAPWGTLIVEAPRSTLLRLLRYRNLSKQIVVSCPDHQGEPITYVIERTGVGVLDRDGKLVLTFGRLRFRGRGGIAEVLPVCVRPEDEAKIYAMREEVQKALEALPARPLAVA